MRKRGWGEEGRFWEGKEGDEDGGLVKGGRELGRGTSKGGLRMKDGGGGVRREKEMWVSKGGGKEEEGRFRGGRKEGDEGRKEGGLG